MNKITQSGDSLLPIVKAVADVEATAQAIAHAASLEKELAIVKQQRDGWVNERDQMHARSLKAEAELLRLQTAARNVVEMLPFGPDRYELEVAIAESKP